MKSVLPILFALLLLSAPAFSQTLTVTSPNGAETWAGCTTHNITWSASGTSNFYSIDYSIDGGSSWTAIASFYNTTSGSFSWTVPNVASVQALVRVTDSNNPATVDVSNAVFTITSPLQLTSPNGGEVWEGLTTQAITWVASGTSNRYNIEYSTDGGASWNAIISNHVNSTGTYNWSVPNIPTTLAQVRITDYYTVCMRDKSNNIFEIAKASPEVTAPNGGESWFAGTSQNISWVTSSFLSPNVDIEYSTNNGSVWNTIALSTPNDGSFSWSIPNAPSMQSLVRVSESGNPAEADTSDAVFNIEPHIRITSPNGSESWLGCDLRNITWLAGGTSTQYKIELSTDGGTSWSIIENNYTTAATSASYTWTVNNLSSANCKIRVSDLFAPSKTDQTDGAFSITGTNNVTVVSPNGGESWKIGTTQQIQYTTSGSVSNVKIQYSTNSGASWVNITTSTSGGTYNWTLPNVPSNNARIRITDISNDCNYDESDAAFTMLDHITVTSPNGFENWNGCANYAISWLAGGTSYYYDLDYSTNNGSSWNPIVSNLYKTSTSNSHTWTVLPNITSTQMLVRIRDHNDTLMSDVNDYPFTLNESIHIVIFHPNGGENLQGLAAPPPGTGTGTYYLNTTSTVTSCGANFYDSGGPSGSYTNSQNITRTFYPSVSGNKLRFTFTSFSTESCCDRLYIYDGPSTGYPLIGTYGGSTSPGIVTASNSSGALTFRFTSDGSVTGAGWSASFNCVAGSTPNETITWAANNVSNYFDISYSTNGGVNWNGVAVDYYTTSYSFPWAVPNTPSDSCLIRIQDNNNTCKTDQSDNLFTILADDRELTAPNGGETWYAGTAHDIEWQVDSYLDTDVAIEYSTNNGASWIVIETSTPNDGNYNWTVPNTPSTQALVRVSEASTAAHFDLSDAIFTIAPHITLTAPNGGEVLEGCNSFTISWDQGGTSNYFDVEYSTDNGTSWNTLYSNLYRTTTAATVSWSGIPNIYAANSLVRVTDHNDPTKTDMSDAVFNLIQTSEVQVNSPNGGENWQVGTVHPITYSTSGTTTNVRLFYSTDNGATWNTITTSTSGGTYNWTIPNLPSSTCLIRAENNTNNCKFDLSDTTFTILPGTPTFHLTSPDGGEQWFPATSETISWTSQYVIGANVTLEYSTDNGTSWLMIAPSTPNDGSHPWTIANTPSTTVKVRVSEAGNPSAFDLSDANFTIEPHVRVISPNGAESWAGCEARAISWRAGGTSTQYKLEYSTNAGSSWVTIESNYTTTATDINYSWTVANVTSSNMIVRVSDLFAPSKTDQSNAVFTVGATQNAVLNSPNGGENWKIGTTQSILYTTNGPTTSVKLEYSTNSGSSWSNITTSTSGGTYNWTVPNVPSPNSLIRVTDASNACTADQSDASFTIQDHITVTAPNGYENFDGCGNMSITWLAGGTSYYYDIDYSTNNGASWDPVVSNLYKTATSNSHTWSVIPNLASSQMLIRITDTNNPAMSDESDYPFILNANTSIVVLAPDGGESWQGTTVGPVGSGSGNFYMNSNTSVTTCGGTYYDSGGPSGSYTNSQNFTKTFSPNTAGNRLRFSFTSFSTESCCDRLYIYDGPSTGYPLIGSYGGTTSPGVVTATSPGGQLTFRFISDGSVTGSGWAATIQCVSAALPNETITWADNNTSNYFDIDYSTNGGSSWVNVATDYYTTANTYPWAVPNTPSDSCLVRISDNNNSCKSDLSNALFTIIPADRELKDPNGGEIWYAGTDQSINWIEQSYLDTDVKIEYSTNNGASWIVVVASTPNDGSYVWTLPNTPSTQALVKLSQAGDSTAFDVSDASFTIAPHITVTAPNGGQTVEGCSAYTISWNQGGTSDYFDIDYSTNNGASWDPIVSNLYRTSTASTYSWNPVPNEAATQALIRVSDHNDTTKTDVSNASFTLIQTTEVVLTTPNGGEAWEVGTVKPIVYQVSGATTNVRIYYSTDNGLTWNSITTNTSGGIYNWTVPNTPSNICLIRVENYTNSCKFDISDAVFSILPPTPVYTLTAPDGGESWFPNTTENITWTSQYVTAANVKLEYTTDNGTSWATLIPFTPNDGAHPWTIPNSPSTECRVRISEENNPAIFDVSDTTFTIEPPIRVLSPNGGEVWTGCDVRTIQWITGGTSTQFKLEYSTNGGASWALITNNYTTTATNASYSWTVPNLSSANFRVRVSDLFAPAKTDMSDADFTVTQTANAIVSAPNGGESWKIGTTQSIQYSTAGGTTHVRIEYSTDNGSVWNTISTNSSGGTFNWTVPNYPNNNSLIRIEDISNSCNADVSDAVFTMEEHITITSPNGGETLNGCQAKAITWVAGGASGLYNIEYSTNNGSSWTVIVAGYSSGGTSVSYNWTPVVNLSTTQALIRVTDAGNPAKTDQSDAAFTILGNSSIALLSPDGGEIWQGTTAGPVGTGSGNYYLNTTSSVTTCGGNFYDSGGPSGNYTNSQNITRTFYPSTAGNKLQFNFSFFSTESCCDRLYIYDGPSTGYPLIGTYGGSSSPGVVTATSAGGQLTFRFTSDGSVVGSGWAASIQCISGAAPNETITWAASGTSNYFDIDYSTDAGSSWVSIADDYYTTSYTYAWAVPNTPSSNCLVRVEDANNSCKTDMSDGLFTITPAFRELTSPDGGETWYEGTTQGISWKEESFLSSNVMLEYSTNNGASWLPIVASTPNDGAYSWIIPATTVVLPNCLVRVSEAGNPSLSDVSDAVFTIRPAILITSPNGDTGGQTWRACTQSSITWEAGVSSLYTIELSVDSGMTWTAVATNYSNGASNVTYNWSIPNTPSSKCLVRVRDVNNPAYFDLSNAVFTISPSIKITYPNQGESLLVGASQTISWISDGASNFYNIDYSTNGGTTWTNVVTSYNTTADTFAWTVPNTPSTNCMLRITDNVDNCKEDMTDVPFTITNLTPVITVTSPNGGESWNGCNNTEDITWTATATSNTFKLEYSTNGGSSWIVIQNSLNTMSGTFSWSVPNVSSSTALVRVSDTNNPAVADQSNSVFTINAGGAANVTASGPLSFCAGDSVILTSDSATGNLWSPGGETTQSITITTSGSYSVTVDYGNGCMATSSPVVVSVNTGPVANAGTDVILFPGGSSAIGGSPTGSGGSGALSYSWSPATGLDSATDPNPIANPGSTTTYTVTVTDQNGCTATDAVKVSLSGCGKDSFEPNNVQSSAKNLYGGAFGSLGDMRICPPGDIDWYFFTTNGTRTIRIRLEGLPADFDVELYTSGGMIGSSVNSGTANELILAPGSPAGTYYVKVLGKGGAWNPTVAYKLIVNTILPPPVTPGIKNVPSAGTSKEEIEESVKVYPNPATDLLNVALQAQSDGRLRIRMTDLSGKTIRDEAFEVEKGENLIPIALDRLPAGAYLLWMEKGGRSWTEKVVLVNGQ